MREFGETALVAQKVVFLKGRDKSEYFFNRATSATLIL